MIDKTQYMTTGELAKMMHITKETLFHYDKIGLFCPEVKLENEYRYYSIYQIELLDVILMLKDLGMPLKEIKQFMDRRQPESLLELFRKEEREIDQKISLLKAKKRRIKEKSKKIRMLSEIAVDEVTIREVEERYCLKGHAESMEDRALYKEVALLQNMCDEANVQSNYEITFIQYLEDVAKGEYDKYQDILLIMSQIPKGLAHSILPAGRYVECYHKGHYNTIGESYRRLLAFCESQGITTTGVFMETYMVDRLLVDDYKEYITQIQVQIIE